MSTRWSAHAKRIDALSLRERGFLFLSAAMVVAAFADTLVLSPALAEQKALSVKLAKESDELKVLRAQLLAATQPVLANSPEGQLRSAIAQLQGQQTELSAEIERRLNSHGQRAQLPDVLERALRRHQRLRLLKLATVTEAPSTAAQAPAPAASGVPSLHWQGVDLSVAGNYLDLMNYLAELEQALPGLRWGELGIAADAVPPVLTVRVYLAGEAS